MKRVINITFEIFSSLRLTIVLLIIILLYLSISTFLPDDTSYYKSLSEYNSILFFLLKITGLTNPYHSFFIAIWLFIFTFNLIACTLNRLPSITERLKRNLQPSYIQIESMVKYDCNLPSIRHEDILRSLISGGYKFSDIEKDGVKYITIKKGLYAPLNFLFVHISILIIIAGITISVLFGYEGFIRLSENRSEHLFYREIMNKNYIKVPLNFKLRLNNFSNITIPSGQSVDYISDITIIENGREINTKIKVNEPLKHKGIVFAQSSYELNYEDAVFTLKISDITNGLTEIKKIGLRDEIEFMGKRLKITDFFENVHNMGPAIKILYDNVPIIAVKNKPEIQNEESGIRVYIEDIKIPYDSILKITYDPGTEVVFLGSFLFLFALILSIFYRFRAIAIKMGENIEIYYTGKNIETEILDIISTLTNIKERV